MPVFYDSQNQSYTLSERLGSGGEGTVYACDDENLVAKIYHEPLAEEKAEKLLWMAAHKNERLLKVAAWVVDVLRDTPDGKIVGFLMPNFRAKEIHELYSLKSRRVYFPDATWHFLVHTAANLARAFYNLHRDAHVMGDVNHGNCVVMRDGTVKLIDCDSYSIKTDKLRYPCEVGVATHLAPELQGVNLRGTERENKHDNFGLAVIIFQLLFLGRHPFAGNYLGDEDKSLEDCIREYRFAYGSSAAVKNVRQPPGTLPLAAVSPRVALMFEQAFLTEERPEPREWIEALEDLSNNLEQCALHPGHLYFNELNDCPWCEIEMQTGLMLFPFVTAGEHLSGDKPFNIFTVENLIASFGFQNTLPAILPPAMMPPSPEMLEERTARRNKSYVIVALYLFTLLFMNWTFGIGVTFMLGTILAFFLISLLINTYSSVRQPIEEMLASNQQQFKKIENERTRTDASPIISENLVKIRSKISAYQNFQRKSVGELKSLQTDVSRREFYKYLRSQKISDAQTLSATESERKMLTAIGVKTAAEIDEIRLRHFYKVNDEMIPKLLEWRERLIADFDRDEDAAKNIKAEQTQFISQNVSKRRHIERDIEQLLILLRAGAVHLKRDRQMMTAKAEELSRQIVQFQTDLQTVGSSLPAIIALILITVFTPMSGVFTTRHNYNDPPVRTAYGVGDGSGSYAAKNSDNYADSKPVLPTESMTDAEIGDLSQTERIRLAENLYNTAITYNYDDIDRVRAEKLSRQAIRLAPDQPRFLNQLGYALYGQKKYDESLKYLNRSLKYDAEKGETKIFISMNYLATNRFKDSVKILNEVVKKNPDLFEAYYSLGLAFNGLKNYRAAEEVFRRAAEIKPSEADAHYQLGVCLYKLKKKDGLQNEYETLLTLNKSLAEKLAKESKINGYGIAEGHGNADFILR